jgi:hypothetical protein
MGSKFVQLFRSSTVTPFAYSFRTDLDSRLTRGNRRWLSCLSRCAGFVPLVHDGQFDCFFSPKCTTSSRSNNNAPVVFFLRQLLTEYCGSVASEDKEYTFHCTPKTLRSGIRPRWALGMSGVSTGYSVTMTEANTTWHLDSSWL